MLRRSHPGLFLALFLSLGACGSPKLKQAPPTPILEAYDVVKGGPEATAYESGEGARLALGLEGLLAATQKSARKDAQIRFWTSYCLALLHARAADDPFLAAHGPAWLDTGALELGDLDNLDPRPNETGHLLASIDNATRALSLMRRQDPELIDFLGQPVPGGAKRLSTRLRLLTAMSFTRLGFDKRVRDALARTPELLSLDTYAEFLDDYGIRPRLRPWMCYMVSHYLRRSDETTAYRFAILAIEGKDRFGVALPKSGVLELEDWILRGANSRFVCPQSETEYLPGQKSSPISGIPHFEYVAVRR